MPRDNTSLTLAGSSQVLGVKNIFLGATQGQVTASGNGSNYNPYLDIFSAKNNDNHSHTSGTGDVALNGLVVAGINNDVTITIDIGATAPTLSTTSPIRPLVRRFVDAHPRIRRRRRPLQPGDELEPPEDPVHHRRQLQSLPEHRQPAGHAERPDRRRRSGPRSRRRRPQSGHHGAAGADPTGDIQRQINTLIQQAPFTSNAPGNAFAFGDILVSAGNVSILAQKLTGNSRAGQAAPSVTARSSPMIKIENKGLDFMDLANLTVTNVTGGNITYRQIDHVDPDSHSNVTFTATPSATPIIDISATYNRIDPSSGLGVDQNGNQLTRTPDIYFDGVVTNENGLLKITNQLGSVVASQSLNAATIQMVAPNGSFIFLGGVGSFYSSNHDVASQWAGCRI